MSDFMLAVESIFSNTWTLLTSVTFPGTEMSIAQILVGAFMACFSLRVLAHALGLGITVSDIRAPNSSARSSSTSLVVSSKGGIVKK